MTSVKIKTFHKCFNYTWMIVILCFFMVFICLGLFVSINTAGYACGAPVMNWVFDRYGSYKPILLICCLIMAVVTVTFQFVVTASERKRREKLC